MSKLAMIIGLSVLILSAFLRPRDASTGRRVSELEAQISRLTGELAAERSAHAQTVSLLEAERRKERGPIAQEAPAAAVEANAVEAPSASAPASAAAVTEPEDQASLQRAFMAQDPDPSWAPGAEQLILTRLRSALPKTSKLESVVCGTLLCRIDTVHPNQDALDAFYSDAFGDLSKRPWQGDAFTYVESKDAQDRLVTISFLAREGSTLPSE
jgi:hypothetical protein